MMQNNRYYSHRHEIAAVSESDNWPVDIATDIVRKRHGWGLSGEEGEELRAWLGECRRYQMDKDKTLRDLFA